jgi:hypothetical protein
MQQLYNIHGVFKKLPKWEHRDQVCCVVLDENPEPNLTNLNLLTSGFSYQHHNNGQYSEPAITASTVTGNV